MPEHIGGSGTEDDPWILTTPPGSSEFDGWRDETTQPPALVIRVGSTKLTYELRCIEDLHAMLASHGDWMPLGNADEQKEAKPGTVEAWARAADNPVGGLVRPAQGLPRPLRQLRAPRPRTPRPGRGRAQRRQQPHARNLTTTSVLHGEASPLRVTSAGW